LETETEIATSDNWCGWHNTQRQKLRSSLDLYLPFHLSTKACDIWGMEQQAIHVHFFSPNMVDTPIYDNLWPLNSLGTMDFLNQWILDSVFSHIFPCVSDHFLKTCTAPNPPCFEISLPLCAVQHLTTSTILLCWIH
jgi:hypothetical protein